MVRISQMSRMLCQIFDSKDLSNSYLHQAAAGSTKTKVKEKIEPSVSDELEGNEGERKFPTGVHPIFILSIRQAGSTTGISVHKFHSVLAKGNKKYTIRNHTSK